MAGTIGGVTLIVYLILLGAGSFRAAATTRGISLALFATILFRCMTEAPLTLGTILNGDFLTHLILFAIVLHSSTSPKQQEVNLQRTNIKLEKAVYS